jgi:hypothetical protein
MMGDRLVRLGAGALLLLVAVTGFVLLARGLYDRRPRLTEETARAIVTTTLQRETRAAFLVTGTLDISATTRFGTTTRFLPGLLDMPVGRTEATVRAPGRVSYGIDIAELGADAIAVYGDTIEIRVPTPRVFSVEPFLDAMEVETRTGWLRPRGEAREHVQQRAIGLLRAALDEQGRRHIADTEQPRINTAETLHEMLRPAFAAAGVPEPVFVFRISDQLVYRGGDSPPPRGPDSPR